jgi:DNA excision repair protein ERCC-6
MDKNKPAFDTSIGEIRLLFAILFTSGYAPLPRRRLYWEIAQDVHNAAISGAMTRNRFEELMMCFHVADNEHLPVGDRMAKVRPLFTALNERFVAAFPRHTHLSIDESMVPYYGRHSAKQFIRGKPIRFGFKVWSINTPLGYCVQMDPYQGAGVTDIQLGLGGSVVVKLADALPADNYFQYFDNFFTSMNLLHALGKKNIRATGTVRVNRTDQCPVMSVDVMKKMDRGAYDYRQDLTTGIIVTRWNDNSVVTMASNCHCIEPLGTAKRWSRAEKKSVDITQPSMIDQYNRNMGGVDRMDQNISTYRMSIR